VLAQPLLAVSLEAPPPLPESRADEAGVLSAGVESNPGEARLNPLLNVAHAQLSIETMLMIPTIHHPAKGSSSRGSTRVTRGARTPTARRLVHSAPVRPARQQEVAFECHPLTKVLVPVLVEPTLLTLPAVVAGTRRWGCDGMRRPEFKRLAQLMSLLRREPFHLVENLF
jgi:hypothetical protein